MDEIAIQIVNYYDNIVRAIGANTLIVSPTPSHGYMIVLAIFFFIFGNGFFFFWHED